MTRPARRLLAPLLALVTLAVAGCQLPTLPHPGSRAPAAPPETASGSSTSPGSTPTSSTPSAAGSDAGATVQRLLQKIDGVRDPYSIADPNDLDCVPGEENVNKLDVRFTADDATAMRTALLAGRSYQRGQSEVDYLCLIGSYPGDRRSIQIDLTNDFSGADDTWPSSSMITALVRSSRQQLKVGKVPLRWAATTDTDSSLSVGADLGRAAPTDARAIAAFTQLQQHWEPLSGYSRVNIAVPTKSGGYLSATQQNGSIKPWKADIPAGMITIFRTEVASLGDVDLSRTVTSGTVHDRFDFLYAGSDSTLSWPRRQQVAHRVIKAYWALPPDQRGNSFSIRSGPHTELDFDTTSCNGILPGMDHRQDAPQTRALYRWYAEHFPEQAEKGGVDHCLGQHS